MSPVRPGGSCDAGTRDTPAPADFFLPYRGGLAITAADTVARASAVGGQAWEEVPPPSGSPLPKAVCRRRGFVKTQQRKPIHDAGFVDPKQGGKAAYASGNHATAVEQYRQAAEHNPNDADALNNLGQTLVRVGKAAEALPYFQRAVSLYPSVWAYRFNLAKAHGEIGNWREAVENYRHAQTLFPDDYVTTFNLGMALHKLGDEEAAVTEFRRGRARPGEASFHLSLGISYEQLNKPGEAANAYERYLSLSPSAAEADKLKARIEQLRKPA